MGVFNKRRICDDVVVVDNYESYMTIREERQGFHWSLWLLWFMILCPITIIMVFLTFTRKVYLVKLKERTGRRDKWWVSAKMYEEITDKLVDERYSK